MDLSVDASYLAHQKAKRIDKVDTRLIDEQTRVVLEVWLPGTVWLMSPSISEPGYDVNMSEVTDQPLVRYLLDLAIPWLPSPVLVHHESDARRFGIFDDSLTGFEVIG